MCFSFLCFSLLVSEWFVRVRYYGVCCSIREFLTRSYLNGILKAKLVIK